MPIGATSGSHQPFLIRNAAPSDRSQLLAAILILQEHEQGLHDSRLSGAEIAEPYLRSIMARTSACGAILIAERDHDFAGFVAGWIEQMDALAETPDSNRFGYISDICILPAYRGKRLATQLLRAIERRLAGFGITRLRINALAANKSARASYERSGFRPYEVMHEKCLG
jgi:ribosomal protein S18 acetylase RimI-like enzyme